MPYINSLRREQLDTHGTICEDDAAGVLNYMLTRTIQTYLQRHKGYQGINDIIGALEACKLEFYRRVVVPYEDKKIQENGDVY